MSGESPPPSPPEAGLCTSCVFAAVVRSSRSAFLRCGLSDTDPAFPRYPRLPVLACAGFEPLRSPPSR
jgi:hypothetical protein